MSTQGSSDSVRSYLKEIGRHPLLSHEQEITLGRKVQRMMDALETKEEMKIEANEDLAGVLGIELKELKRLLRDGRKAKDLMVTSNLRLVVSVAKKYTKRNMELMDLIQEGTIGLVRGVEKFDPTRGYKFSTYAYWWIRQGITRAIAEKSRAIRLPIHITENLNKLKKAQRELSQMQGRMPTTKELAGELGIDEAEVKDLLCKARHPASLETRIGENRDTALIDMLEDVRERPEDLIEEQLHREQLESALIRLPELQEEVLRMRYGIGGNEPMSMTAVASTLNMSRDRVRLLERKALNVLQLYARSSIGLS